VKVATSNSLAATGSEAVVQVAIPPVLGTTVPQLLMGVVDP
jgi:hypothetical protein